MHILATLTGGIIIIMTNEAGREAYWEYIGLGIRNRGGYDHISLTICIKFSRLKRNF